MLYGRCSILVTLTVPQLDGGSVIEESFINSFSSPHFCSPRSYHHDRRYHPFIIRLRLPKVLRPAKRIMDSIRTAATRYNNNSVPNFVSVVEIYGINIGITCRYGGKRREGLQKRAEEGRSGG